MAGGEAGVDRTLQILSEQIARTMRLLGVSSLEELEPGHVTQLARLSPIAQPAADTVAATPVRKAPAIKAVAAKASASKTAESAEPASEVPGPKSRARKPPAAQPIGTATSSPARSRTPYIRGRSLM